MALHTEEHVPRHVNLSTGRQFLARKPLTSGPRRALPLSTGT